MNVCSLDLTLRNDINFHGFLWYGSVFANFNYSLNKFILFFRTFNLSYFSHHLVQSILKNLNKNASPFHKNTLTSTPIKPFTTPFLLQRH